MICPYRKAASAGAGCSKLDPSCWILGNAVAISALPQGHGLWTSRRIVLALVRVTFDSTGNQAEGTYPAQVIKGVSTFSSLL